VKDAHETKQRITGFAAEFSANKEYSQGKNITQSQKVTARVQLGINASQFDEPDINQQNG
jgi:hypothetical protein